MGIKLRRQQSCVLPGSWRGEAVSLPPPVLEDACILRLGPLITLTLSPSHILF